MARKNEAVEEKKVERIESTDLKPKQNVLNLDSGADEKLEFSHKRYSPAKDAFADANAIEETLNQAQELFGGDKRAIAEALIDAATRRAYAESKKAALAKGNYLTQEIRTRIVNAVRNLNPNYAELDASAAFNKWSAGYKDKKPGAVKILALVTQESDEFEL